MKRVKLDLNEDAARILDRLAEAQAPSRAETIRRSLSLLDIWERMAQETEPRVEFLGGRAIANKAAIEDAAAREWRRAHASLHEEYEAANARYEAANARYEKEKAAHDAAKAELDRLRHASLQGAKDALQQGRVFICHADEDKDAIARPLARMLGALSVSVWYDEYSLKLGDSLRASIEKGVAECSYGVVILSPSFFMKKWTAFELDGLTSREMLGDTVILPVWHDVGFEEVAAHLPSLAGKIAARSSDGLDRIVSAVVAVIAGE